MANRMKAQTPKKKLRFGILTPDLEKLEAWQVDAFTRLCELNETECVIVLCDERIEDLSIDSIDTNPRQNEKYSAFKRYLIDLQTHSITLQKRNLPSVLIDIPKVFCDTSTEGFTDEVLDNIAAYHLDFLLTFRCDSPSSKLIRAFPMGVWSFSSQGIDGKMTVFQAILQRNHVVSTRLWRLGDSGQADEILQEGISSVVHHSYIETLDKVHILNRDWPVLVCRRMLGGHAHHPEKQIGEDEANTYQTPSSLNFLRLRLRLLLNTWRKFEQSLWFEQWNVGVVPAPIQTSLEAFSYDSVKWLEQNEKQTFLADPFAIQTNRNQLTILAEEYDCRVGRGVISAVEYAMDGKVKKQMSGVLNLPVHMSYPYLFQHEGHIYCIPETYQAGRIDLFRANHFPDSWERVTTLVDGFAGIDATVFLDGDLWWLFCTDRNRDPHGSLCAWYSERLMGPWKPHQLNPIKTDVRGSRPAGSPFWHNGELFRPAQDCSETYGGRIVIHKITTLSPTDFQEEMVNIISPSSKGRYRMGIHTMCSVGDYTVVDGKRRVWNFPYVQSKLQGYYKHYFRRLHNSAPTQLS